MSPPFDELQAQTCRGSFPSSYEYDDYIPMVDKAVDASWKKELPNEKFVAANGTISPAISHLK